MHRFLSSSFAGGLLIVLVTGLLTLGGCTQESVTGPDPVEQQDEQVQVEGDTRSANDTSTDDPDHGHNH
jgi:hypothetical protein